MSGGGRMRSVPDCVAKEQETALRKVVASLGWALEPIPADGSCQFAALARLNSQFTAQSLRRAVAASAPSHPPPQLEGAVLRWYLDSLHKPDTWGDEYTLQRAGECASCRVYVLRADCLDTWELIADPLRAAHTAFLVYREGHNDAVDPPAWFLAAAAELKGNITCQQVQAIRAARKPTNIRIGTSASPLRSSPVQPPASPPASTCADLPATTSLPDPPATAPPSPPVQADVVTDRA